MEYANKTKGRGDAISPELFIRTWQEATNITDVSDKLGMTRVAVLSRGYLYSKKGVPLKRLQTSRSYDWEELAEMAGMMLDVDND